LVIKRRERGSKARKGRPYRTGLEGYHAGATGTDPTNLPPGFSPSGPPIARRGARLNPYQFLSRIGIEQVGISQVAHVATVRVRLLDLEVLNKLLAAVGCDVRHLATVTFSTQSRTNVCDGSGTVVGHRRSILAYHAGILACNAFSNALRDGLQHPCILDSGTKESSLANGQRYAQPVLAPKHEVMFVLPPNLSTAACQASR
jgi:hypothetical protein